MSACQLWVEVGCCAVATIGGLSSRLRRLPAHVDSGAAVCARDAYGLRIEIWQALQWGRQLSDGKCHRMLCF